MKHKAHSFSPAVIKTAEGRVDSDFQTDAERVWNWKDPMMCRVFLLFFCFLAGWGRMTVEMRPDALERMVTQKGGSAEVAISGTDVARRKRTERTEGGGESAGVDRRNLAHKGKRQVKVGASGEAGQRIDSGESLGVAGKSVAHVVRQQKRGKNAGHGKSCH